MLALRVERDLGDLDVSIELDRLQREEGMEEEEEMCVG